MKTFLNIKIFIIFIFLNLNVYGNEPPKTILYAVLDGYCCGGEESDPHAVHGVEAPNNGFILSGKSIDKKGFENGFVIKIPNDLPKSKLFLNPEEEFSFDWSHNFGTDGRKDGANGSAYIFNSVFVAGYLQNDKGVIDRYLSKINIADGSLIWKKTFPSNNANKNSAFESIQTTSDNGLILSGVKNSNKETFEGFKSYGNPQSGNAFVMYLNKEQIASNSPPTEPFWETDLVKSLSGKTVKELMNDEKGFIIASSSLNEPRISKLIKIDNKGKIIWSKEYPVHGEITDLDVSYINNETDGYYISGHNHDKNGGIDGSITKISKDGSLIWNKNYGNPNGGKNKFKGLDSGNKKLIFDECWGISSLVNGGAVMACGTGIEDCEEFNNDAKLYSECKNDPRTTWRSLLIRVNKHGDKIWEKFGSFTFPGEEDDTDVPSTASEYVFITNEGNIVSVIDLSFGVGLEILKKE